jgi:hypothetical protein
MEFLCQLNTYHCLKIPSTEEFVGLFWSSSVLNEESYCVVGIFCGSS